MDDDNHDAAKVAEIAGSLNRERKERLLAFTERGAGYFTAPRTIAGRALALVGLVENWGVASLRLTPLGLAVREYLKDSRNAQ